MTMEFSNGDAADTFQRLDADFELHPLTLRFHDPSVESRFAQCQTLRARQYHDGMWLIRAWLVLSRAVHEVTRVRHVATVEVYLNCSFVAAVSALYATSRRHNRAEEGTTLWQVLVLALVLVHAIQFASSYMQARERGARAWARYYFLGLDFAIDSMMFTMLFGLRQPAVLATLCIEVAALVICLETDTPSTGASAPGLIDALVFALALLACARAKEKASRAAFARDIRHDIRHSIDLRALQQPFSAGNLAAWLRAFANRNASSSSTCRIESAGPLDFHNEDPDDIRAREGGRDPDGSFREAVTGRITAVSATPLRQSETPPQGVPALTSDRGQSAQGSMPSGSAGGNCPGTGAGGSFASAHHREPTITGSSVANSNALARSSSLLSTKRFETLQNWEIDYDRLRVVRKIGAGSAGHVYKGEYIGAVVAIKQLYSTFIDPHNLDEFSREVTLLHKLKHPHVLTFYGIARRDVYCYIVTEFCPYALDAILCGGRGKDASKPPPRLSVVRRVRIAHEVALALAYLHAERVLHHDLKPGNILLNSDFVARVSDFGLSQLVSRESEIVASGASYTTLGGTATFSAPEITLGRVRPGFKALSKLDVFSFGIVLAATFAPNGDPYYFYVGDRADEKGPTKNGAFELEIMHAVAYSGLRPRVPAALPDEIRPLMERCWSHNPDDRPSFDDLVRDLRAFLVRRKELEASMPTRLPVGPEAIGADVDS